jgi:hypothetical protein
MKSPNSQPSPSDNSAFIQGKLLVGLGVQEVFRLNEFNKETPAVAHLLDQAQSPHFQSQIGKVLNVNVPREQEAISLLGYLLRTIGFQLKKTRQSTHGIRFYKIVSQGDNDSLILQSILNLKDEVKLIEFFQKLFNKYNPLNQPGIYKIICLTTKDFYIGSCKNFAVRFKQHKKDLKGFKPHYNRKLQELWTQYGEKNFEFQPIEVTENYKERERYLIKKLKPTLNSKYPGLLRISSEIDERLKAQSKHIGKSRIQLAEEVLDKGLRELEA